MQTGRFSIKEELNRWLPIAEEVISICRSMYPVKGLIVSPDIERAFKQLQQVIPDLTLHHYPTGAMAEDWEVPPSWEVEQATLTDNDGTVIASHNDQFLFVAPYSEPVDGWFSKAEISAHCRTNRTVPNGFSLEHRNAYNFQLVDWGITLPYERLQCLSDSERYHVKIETKTEPGHLYVGEWVLPGKRQEVICICSQFDELCNDGQSSAVTGALLMRALAELPEREFTYQLLLVPEMFGTLYFAFNNPEILNRTVAMLNLETLGAGEQWVLKQAFRNGGALEQSLRVGFEKLNVPYKEINFFDGFGNDERVYGWPTIGIPGPGIQRFPFKEYHTELDTPDILDASLLSEALAVCFSTIDTFEKNYIPKYTRILQPWLTKHELYTELWNNFSHYSELNNELLYYIDGKTSLLELTKLTNVPFDIAYNFLELAYKKGLIRKLPCEIDDLRR